MLALSFFPQAVDCGRPKVPVNGTVVGEKTTFLSKVTFLCNDGFDLTGSTSRTCQANKQWSGQETSCSGNCNFILQVLVVLSYYQAFLLRQRGVTGFRSTVEPPASDHIMSRIGGRLRKVVAYQRSDHRASNFRVIYIW